MLVSHSHQAEILTTLLAGVGLFFTGIRFLGDHLRQLADHRMRVLLARATQNDHSAAAMGFLGGSVMQSMNAVVFVLVSLVTARVIDVRRALPAINFANLGSSVLVILAAFDPKTPILLLLFGTGLLLHGERDRSARLRQATRALLGLGLLGLGLVFIKTSGHSLGELPWMSALLSASERSLVIAFIVGAVLAFAVQSASSVTLVTMALSGSGIIDLSHSLLVVYGAGIGGGASTWLLGAAMKGLGKQLVLYQFALKAAGLVLLLPLAMIEFLGHVPLVAAVLDSLPATLSLKIAFSYLLFQIACDLVMHAARHPVCRLLERVAPPTVAEEISQPQYIYHDAQQDPPSAVLLTTKEQERLLQLLPFYLDSVRDLPAHPKNRRMLYQGSSQVTETCHRFLEALLATQMSAETLEIAVSLKDRNQLLSGLQETVNELAAAVERVHHIAAPDSEPRVLAGNLVETLHLMLETLAEAAGQTDTELVITLKALTADRSELLQDIRRRLLAGGQMDSTVRETVFDALSLFERSLWLMRHYAMRLAPRNA
jgi:phosphate:Na+ symporter